MQIVNMWSLTYLLGSIVGINLELSYKKYYNSTKLRLGKMIYILS